MRSDLPGRDRLGPYRLRQKIGVGAMGTVYLADGEEGPVALKVVHPTLLERAGTLRRFRQEAVAGQRVDHPHVVRTLDAGQVEHGGQPCCYLVMEYVEGRTLRGLLEDLEIVPEALVREIAVQAAAGLAAIHEAGIVHRDLKPENVLISRDQRVRIMDLGMARLADATSDASSGDGFAGSLPYAAPEQFRGGVIDARADLYSLGVVLNELVTGRNPFHRDAAAEILRAHLDVKPLPPSQLAEVSTFLSEVILTLLAKDPDERFASADALHQTLTAGEQSPWWHERWLLVQARGPKLPRLRVSRATRLHGREAELAVLREAWQDAQRGRGRVLWLEGEAGIGKTRLLDTFLRDLDDPHAHVLYGSYPPMGGRGGISDGLIEHLGEAGLEEQLHRYVGAMRPLVPALSAALRRQLPPSDVASPLPGALRVACVEVMRSMARERPVVWIVEDLHFADAEGRGRALALAHAVAGERILLVLTSRPRPAETSVTRTHLPKEASRLVLGRLSAREVVLLLQEAFQSHKLADRLGARIALKSDGVPFFVFEMIRELKEHGFISKTGDGSWIESRLIERIEVPSAVKELIEVRMGSATKEERAILDVGAVAGYVFDPRLLAEVLDRKPVALLQDLAHVERRSGVIRAQERAYRFDHHQVQEVVYEQLPTLLREEYHAALGDALVSRRERGDLGLPSGGEVATEICRHYFAGRRDAKAFPHLREALEFLHAVYQTHEVAALAETALSSPGLLEGEDRIEVLLDLASDLHRLGRQEEERQALDEAVALARQGSDLRLRARALEGLGRWLQLTASYEEAIAVLKEALDAAVADQDLKSEMQVCRTLGDVAYARGRFEECREFYQRQRDLARALDSRHGEADAIGKLGTALGRLGRNEEALACCLEYLAVSREFGDLYGEGAASGNTGVTLTSLGRFDEAEEHFERQLQIARETGNRQGEARATGYLASIDVYRGRTSHALAKYEREREIAREIGDLRAEALAIGNRGMCLSRLGRFEEAGACYERWLEMAKASGNRAAEATAHGFLGSLTWTQGKYEEAGGHYELWLGISREIGDRNGEAQALGSLGVVRLREGAFREAHDLISKHLAMQVEMADPRGESTAALQLGDLLLDLGRSRQAGEFFERGLRIAREIGDRQIERRGLESVGALHLFHGRLSEATKAYREAEAIAEELEEVRSVRWIRARSCQVRHASGSWAGAEEDLRAYLDACCGDGDRRGEAYARAWLGRLHEEAGRVEDARLAYEAALTAAQGDPDPQTRALLLCRMAALPDGDVGKAARTLENVQARISRNALLEARLLLWQATEDASHLEEASRLLADTLAHAPADCRASMCENVPVIRAIRATPR